MTSVPPPNVYLPIPAFAPGVRDAIYRHVYSDRSNELGGLLVGDRRAIGDIIVGAIPAHGARGDVTSLTFTQASWATMLSDLDARYPGATILGWYHSHPGHGIFLSKYDRFIHEHFFSAPWQIAIVVEPHRHEEGLFMWRQEGLVQVAAAPIDAAWADGVAQAPAAPANVSPASEGGAVSHAPGEVEPAADDDERRAEHRRARRAAERERIIRRRRAVALTALGLAALALYEALRLAVG